MTLSLPHDSHMTGEHASLNAIHEAVPNFCPKSHAHGAMSSGSKKYFLVTDFLDLRASGPSGSGESIACKLAKLHSTPAPPPEGYDKPLFGFHVSTCCGDTVQDNSWKESWASFYAENRLMAILKAGIKKNGHDGELSAAVEKVANKVVPRLIGDATIKTGRCARRSLEWQSFSRPNRWKRRNRGGCV